MSLTLVSNNKDISNNIISLFANNMLHITLFSSHTYEFTVHRLITELIGFHHHGQLTSGEYTTIIGTGADVADFFHYDIELLKNEENSWYRASLIHQIGQGMLQAIARIRPDFTRHPFFTEAISGLSIGKALSGNAAPITCRQWTNGLPSV